MGSVFGYDCVLANNSATYETPTWGALDCVVEATCTGTRTEGEVTNRASAGNGMFEPGKRLWEISGTVKADGADAGFVLLRDAYLNGSKLDIWALDGPVATVGSQGVRAEWKVFEWTRTEPEDGPIEYSFKLKPCRSANPPAWEEVEE